MTKKKSLIKCRCNKKRREKKERKHGREEEEEKKRHVYRTPWKIICIRVINNFFTPHYYSCLFFVRLI
jgi:hypothetical protein